MQVRLGNAAPHQGVRDPKTDAVKFETLDGPSVTTVDLPGFSALQAAQAITSRGGVWENHSPEPPSWVSSDDPVVEQLLAEHYGCRAGEPKRKGTK